MYCVFRDLMVYLAKMGFLVQEVPLGPQVPLEGMAKMEIRVLEEKMVNLDQQGQREPQDQVVVWE